MLQSSLVLMESINHKGTGSDQIHKDANKQLTISNELVQRT